MPSTVPMRFSFPTCTGITLIVSSSGYMRKSESKSAESEHGPIEQNWPEAVIAEVGSPVDLNFLGVHPVLPF